ncbi:TPA: hypothetical protein HA249_00415 [Candidatus Woesearchaeota archaeon]|nr:hypothetical protein [Candidatus Woesearchaeota archaeon]
MDTPSLTETVTQAWEALPDSIRNVAVRTYVAAPLLAPTLAYADTIPKTYPGPKDFVMITAGCAVTGFVVAIGEGLMRHEKIPVWGRALAHVPTAVLAGAYVASILKQYG